MCPRTGIFLKINEDRFKSITVGFSVEKLKRSSIINALPIKWLGGAESMADEKKKNNNNATLGEDMPFMVDSTHSEAEMPTLTSLLARKKKQAAVPATTPAPPPKTAVKPSPEPVILEETNGGAKAVEMEIDELSLIVPPLEDLPEKTSGVKRPPNLSELSLVDEDLSLASDISLKMADEEETKQIMTRALEIDAEMEEDRTPEIEALILEPVAPPPKPAPLPVSDSSDFADEGTQNESMQLESLEFTPSEVSQPTQTGTEAPQNRATIHAPLQVLPGKRKTERGKPLKKIKRTGGSSPLDKILDRAIDAGVTGILILTARDDTGAFFTATDAYSSKRSLYTLWQGFEWPSSLTPEGWNQIQKDRILSVFGNGGSINHPFRTLRPALGVERSEDLCMLRMDDEGKEGSVILFISPHSIENEIREFIQETKTMIKAA